MMSKPRKKATPNVPREFLHFFKSRYEYLQKPLHRSCPEQTCFHPGTSCDTEDCPCFRDKNACKDLCFCSGTSDCRHIFPGCSCTDDCGETCTCEIFGRNCRQKRCACSGSCSKSPSSQPPAPVMPRESTVHGTGLFALKDMPANTYLGQYTGRIVRHQPNDLVRPKDFIISKSEIFLISSLPSTLTVILVLYIDGDSVGNHLQWINKGEGKNIAAVWYYREGASGTEVHCRLTRRVSEGEEILISYG
jgi:SET domain-containing protein